MTQPVDRTEQVARTSGTSNLGALVSKALELRDLGHADWLELACTHHPEALNEVRAAVESAASLHAMISDAALHDGLVGCCLGGRYQLIARIGAGAMGVVYLAEDKQLRRNVACKVVRHGLMSPEQALERFAREARAMAAVQHATVVTIHDRGHTEEGQVYIVMELVDGISLSEVIEAAASREPSVRSDDSAWLEEQFGVAPRGESSYLRTVVRWTADLALGLAAVHRAGVLHRDIKPSNILVRRDGGPVLLDFGIALLEDHGMITRGLTSVGTPSYMPPEALLRDRKRTPASDVYSLAATLYHLLTLHAPYEGTPTQVLAALATREPQPASQRRPGLPRDLQAILDKGMQRKPAARYASAAAFESDLRAFLEFRPVTARPVTALQRFARHLARSRAALGAVTALSIVALLFGAKAWREHNLDVRRVQYAELQRHFPPNFTVVGVSNRVYRYEADRAALATLLDEAARVALEPLPTFLLRASFRQDHGDPRGAAADMRVIAQFVDTPFARELADRYDAVPNDGHGVAAINLADLPQPDATQDKYLLGYHLLRQDKTAAALEVLADEQVRKIPHAEELFLAFTNFEGMPKVAQRQLALQRYADLIRLEQRLGTHTAATEHIAGRLLLAQLRFSEASKACAQGIELAPRSHVLRINAGFAAYGQGELGSARGHCAVGMDLRPNYAKLVEELLWVEIAENRYEAAGRLLIERAPLLEPKSPTWFDYWSGVVATYAALNAQLSGDTHLQATQVASALNHFSKVADRIDLVDGKSTDPAYRIATALDKKDVQALFLALTELLAEEPENWWRQDLVVHHMPADLSPEATSAMKQVIEAMNLRDSSRLLR